MDIKQNSRKKILFIIWSYTYGGGAETLLTMIVNHLNPEKYDISIIEYEHSDLKSEPVNSNIHVLPPIEKVETPDHQKKGYQAYYTPEVLTARYIKGDYDLYVSFNYQIPTFLLPAETKNIAWIHTDIYDLALENAERERKLQGKAFQKVKKIVAISDFTKKSLVELFPEHREKVIKIYNGIDLDNVRKQAMEDTIEKLDNNAIISVARLDKNKNPLRLLCIFKKVYQIRPDVRLYYLGDGKLRKELEMEITKEGLDGVVKLLGYVDNPYPIIKQASVLCLFSESEGFPMSVMEALALGIPFVSTNVGGCDVLTNGARCGRIIHTDSEAVEAILELMGADCKKLRNECRKSVERFSIDTYISQIEKLFDTVMEEEPTEGTFAD
ncbi:glycosyltransferase [Acetatifactor muris]|uniref:N-acetylgalactosamine-N, N'-diacetylbacillosaminyl-diphospho-undecaprenol 4-alpha-N-acetylgalactosaminyltransferase n=1 Tax=Acetatifactor muris TaxID=879566 RepID=A0A2K4ZG79_9FIRM|nr:glycosyltransferase [Acetatifactor muris]MCR2045726.1 glycosyltransferase [Acetatifactor muris]SOY29464.1 N-acetylgalactosamine-N, N'-diacetylbacillosaminyl-diphospho-undecaprenol 4-alpha-N-acetylgalactosaminyltransferase [Acetatifactor muris]